MAHQVSQVSERIAQLLRELTLEEKARLTAGADHWHTAAVERLGVPRIKMTDGPNGARGDVQSGAKPSALFPCGICLAATWNPELIFEVGRALAAEVRTKGAHVLLGPTINLHRTPLGGRTFECYSEDPRLTAAIATGFVRGLQGGGVGACVKHFVCNDSEFERRSISSDVASRPLRELYLRPFEDLIRDADPWCVMTAYNRINGLPASGHHELIAGILKGEWGYRGLAVSDWGGTHETVGDANAGLDLEMPGPGRVLGPALEEAVSGGAVAEKELDDKVVRLLGLLERAGRFEDPEERPEGSEERPEHGALARRVAAEGIVLLRNEGVLPLDPARLRRVAVIGPNALHGQLQGGGSAFVVPHYQVHPLAAIRERLEPAVEVTHEPACTIPKHAPLFAPDTLRTDAGEPGLDAFYWNGPSFEGPPTARATVAQSQAFFGRVAPAGIDAPEFAVRYGATLAPEESGTYRVGLLAAGRSRLFLDGEEVVDNWTDPDWAHDIFGPGMARERCAEVTLEAGRTYALRVDYLRPRVPSVATVRFGAHPPEPEDAFERAIACAADADVAILVVGTNRDWETEGRDRETLDLPGRQHELIERVSAVQPATVVVVNAGSPVRMDWLERSAAALYTWFGGQELGHALADVLLGDRNPSGRLPITFPERIEDTPAFTSYPGEYGHVAYGEGLFVGYRWYDARRIAPALPFGFGLSYTRFAYGPVVAPEIHPAGEPLVVACDVTNAGARDGQEVVQVYAGPDRVASSGRVARAPRDLVGFAKVEVPAGETRRAEIRLDARAFAYWDPEAGGWRTAPGTYTLEVGASSRDLRSRTTIELRP